MKSAETRVAPRPAGRPRSEQARNDVLEAAYKLLKVKGFQAIGSHEIAKAAGVSSATLYRWWESKEERSCSTRVLSTSSPRWPLLAMGRHYHASASTSCARSISSPPK